MIRWTEKVDSLSLEYNHTVDALLSTLYAVATSGIAGFCLVGVLSIVMESTDIGMALCPLLSAIVLGAISRSCFRHAARLRGWKGWAEIAIRGGSARWGGGPGDRMADLVPVRRFEIVDHALGRPGLVALLPDGRRLDVLGPWIEGERDMIRRLAKEMNAYLATPVDSITAS